MAGEAAVLQWQSDDVGRLVRGIRPVDSAEGISPALGDDRPGGSGASGSGFSVPVQHFWTIRHAMAHFYQRRNGQQQPFWEQRLLGGEIARDVHGAFGVSGLRQTSWESLGRLSEVGKAPNG